MNAFAAIREFLDPFASVRASDDVRAGLVRVMLRDANGIWHRARAASARPDRLLEIGPTIRSRIGAAAEFRAFGHVILYALLLLAYAGAILVLASDIRIQVEPAPLARVVARAVEATIPLGLFFWFWLAILSIRALMIEINAVRGIAAGVCPACGYTIRDLPIDPEGHTTCPECAAAWRREPSPDLGR